MPRLVCPSWRWTPYAGLEGDASQLGAGGGRRPGPSARGAVDNAEQWADRQLDAHVQPGRELLPGPVVDADLAASAALAAPHQQRSAAGVEVGLGERERLTD